jgi:hypothetical protein
MVIDWSLILLKWDGSFLFGLEEGVSWIREGVDLRHFELKDL